MMRVSVLSLLLVPLAAPGADRASCESLTAAHLFKDTTVSSARNVAADAATGTPAYCEVTGAITPVPGSRIGVVYRLPEGWNGKLLGLGGGGYAGNVSFADESAPVEAAFAVTRGYATAQTDAGHPSPAVWDSSWVANPEALTDFSYRAIHLMTGVGKSVVAKYYGRPQARAYFAGCSTGGRQALMEVQRFPADYQGVIAGAPVYNLLTQSNLLLRWQFLTQKKLTLAQVTRLNKAVLDACDEDDGLRDGIVTDPQTCTFDPGALQCSSSGPGGEACLSAEQLAAVRTAYRGVKTSDGTVAAYPLTRGGEGGWARFIVDPARPPGPLSRTPPPDGGLGGFRAAMFGDANYDLSRFDAERDLKKMRTSAFADLFEADNPDISAFVKSGGKLLLWHGADDNGPSAAATIDYYEEARRKTEPRTGPLSSSVRLFIAPGVYHCRGGPGPDRLDLLDTLDRWVETGTPPATLLATKRDSTLSRPLCPYPALPRYKGAGDPNAATSFECR